MALIDRINSHVPATSSREPDMKPVGSIDQRNFEQHLRSDAVQDTIRRARLRWQEAHGTDPAAARIDGQR